MSLDQIKKILADHRAELDRMGVESLRLFGSIARGDDRQESDVDLLVSFEGPATFDRYMNLKFLLEDLLGCRVDLVTRKALRPEIGPQVEREAIRVA